MPAHSSAWGAGYPEYVTQTAGALFKHGDALRPDLDATYSFVDSLLSELSQHFRTSEFLHLGGDELPKTSWSGNATVHKWMESKGFDNNKAMAYFVNRVKGGSMLKAANKCIALKALTLPLNRTHNPFSRRISHDKAHTVYRVRAAV